jgi:hypothetical protein
MPLQVPADSPVKALLNYADMQRRYEGLIKQGEQREAEGKQREAEGKQREAEGKQREAEGKQREAEGKQREAEGKQREDMFLSQLKTVKQQQRRDATVRNRLNVRIMKEFSRKDICTLLGVSYDEDIKKIWADFLDGLSKDEDRLRRLSKAGVHATDLTVTNFDSDWAAGCEVAHTASEDSIAATLADMSDVEKRAKYEAFFRLRFKRSSQEVLESGSGSFSY